MNEPVSKQVGRFVAEQMSQGDLAGPSRQQLAAQRARLVEHVRRGGLKRSWLGPLGLGGGLGKLVIGVSVAAVLLFVANRHWLGGTQALSAEYHGEDFTAGGWVKATQVAEQLQFSDGTQLTLSPDTQARLTKLDAKGAVFNVESGRLDATVTPKTGYRWVFQAGRYQVVVLGTVLSIDWEPETDRLAVEVSRGRVRVEDIRHPEQANEVSAGGRLELGTTPVAVAEVSSAAVPMEGATVPSEVELSPIPPPAAPQPTSIEPLRPRAVRPRALKTDPPLPHLSTSSEAAMPSVKAPDVAAAPAPTLKLPQPVRPGRMEWSSLAAEGHYQKAYSAAQGYGLDELKHTLSAPDLWSLADVQRLAGAAAESHATLKTLRNRFPGHPQSHAATFALGRVAFDAGRYAEAVRWFRTYLGVEGGGVDSEAAQGRLFVALHRSGNLAEARKEAKVYLAHHPAGSYAAIARSVLSSGM